MKRITHTKNSGYAIILALSAVSLVAAGVFILTANCRDLLFGSEQAYIQAISRNLTARALGWGQVNKGRLKNAPSGEPIRLDVGDLEIGQAVLSVSPLVTNDRPPGLTVHSKCSRGRAVIKRSESYLLSR